MVKKPSDARAELQRAREQLAERLRQIRSDESRAAAPLSADAPDRAQEQENDEVLVRLERATQDLMQQYQHAIDRIDQGQYGVCERCGFAIESRRLEAVPQATTCAACAVVPPPRASGATH